MRKLEDQIAHFAKRGDQLDAMRAKAKVTLDHAVAAQQDRLLSGDIDDQRALGDLRDAVASAQVELASIENALATLVRQKSEVEATLAIERERAERVKASADIDTTTNAIEAQVQKTLPVLRELGNALVAVDHLSYEAAQLGRYLLGASSETELALVFVTPELRRLAQAVKDGHAVIPRRPHDPEPAEVVEQAPLMTVFMWKSARFRDHAGVTRIARQWDDAEMPLEIAQRALRCGVAVPVTDPRRAKLKGSRGEFTVDPRSPDIVNLDDENANASQQEPTATNDVNAGFIVLDRSAENRTIEIAVSRR